MHITQESDNAVRIIYCLASENKRKDAKTISGEVCVSLRFSLKILGKLVASGLVNSYKGNCGGYELARAPKDITLLDVITSVEGPYKLAKCVGENCGELCSSGNSSECVFRDVFGEISDDINTKMAAISFEDMLKKSDEYMR